MIILIAVLVLALAGLEKLTSNSVQTGSTCGCSIPAPSTQPPAAQAPTEPETVKSNAALNTSAGIPKLVDLGSTTCVPCKMMASVLDELSAGYKGKLMVQFIDIDKNREAAQQYKVRTIPTQVFVDASGKEFFRHVGYYPKEDILAKFKEHGIDLGKGK